MDTMIKAGELNECASLQVEQSTQTTKGNILKTMVVLDDEVWINIHTLTGQALFYADKLASETTVKLKMRWREDVSVVSRFVTRHGTFLVTTPPVDTDFRHM